MISIFISIEDEKNTTFICKDDVCTKSSISTDYCTTNIYTYKNVKSMLLAAKRIANKDSYIINYDNNGKGIRTKLKTE